jgi:hypothetical protein
MSDRIDKVRKYLYWGGVLGGLLLVSSRGMPESKISTFEGISGIILIVACFGTFMWNLMQTKK